jgi:chromate transporter
MGGAEGERHTRTISRQALFLAFLRMAVSSFGGTLPWAHRVLVVEKRWLGEREFIEALSLCQFLPGPNVVNLSIVVGQRFQGIPGALTAFAGLLVAPFLIVLGLGVLYARYGQAPEIDRILAGISAAAAGLVWAMGIQMARSFARVPRAIVVLALAFLAVGVFQWPILLVLLVIAPLSIAAAWVQR